METKARGGDAIAADILAVALEALETGEPPLPEGLRARFPGRGAEVDRVLAALGAYQDELASTREQHRPAMGNVLDAGTRLGDYRIHSVLGRGAMGVVYRATQHSLGDREVALKVLDGALVARDPRFLQRFRREAALASKVHAPHLAEVFGFGESGARVFFAMRLVEGPSLALVLDGLGRRRRLGRTEHTHSLHVRRAVEVVRDAARGLAALHAEGLVHRDVKPSNILLAREDGSQRADLFGTATLVDFGLLRPTEASDLTGSLTRLGTPAFAPPELMLGRSATPASDVFSLGVVLHDLLSLSAPHDRDAAAAGLERVRALNPAVDARLAAVLEKALDDKPALRYADGGAFADELDRYLAGEPLRALPANPIARLTLAARRNPGRVARLFALAVLLVLLTAALLVAIPPTVAVYHAASRLGPSVDAGDLRAAADQAHVLVGHATLASLLPGLGEETRRAEELTSGALAPLMKEIESNPEGMRGRAHEPLLRLFFSEQQGADDREPLLAFLVRELQPDRPVLCRLQAARTAAAISIVERLPLLGEDGREREVPRVYRKLTRALVAASEAPAGADGSIPAEGDGTDLRRFATSALSGLGLDAFDALIGRMGDPDPEVRRIAITGTLVLSQTLRSELFGEQGGDLRTLDQDRLERWAEVAWKQTRRVLAERNRDEGKVSGRRKWFVDRNMRFVRVDMPGVLSCLAWLRVVLAEQGLLREWPSVPADMLTLLGQFEASIREYRAGTMPEAVPLDSPALFRGWPGLPLSPDEVRDLSAPLLTPRKTLPQGEKELREPTLVYTNTWREQPEEALPPLAVRNELVEGGNEVLVLPEEPAGVRVRGLPATVTTQALMVSRAGLRTKLEFSRPGESSLTLEVPVPPWAYSARVILRDETPARFPLPNMGSSHIEVSVDRGQMLLARDVLVSTFDFEFSVSPLVLMSDDRLTLTVRYLSTESLYWIESLRVEFERGP